MKAAADAGLICSLGQEVCPTIGGRSCAEGDASAVSLSDAGALIRVPASGPSASYRQAVLGGSTAGGEATEQARLGDMEAARPCRGGVSCRTVGSRSRSRSR